MAKSTATSARTAKSATPGGSGFDNPANPTSIRTDAKVLGSNAVGDMPEIFPENEAQKSEYPKIIVSNETWSRLQEWLQPALKKINKSIATSARRTKSTTPNCSELNNPTSSTSGGSNGKFLGHNAVGEFSEIRPVDEALQGDYRGIFVSNKTWSRVKKFLEPTVDEIYMSKSTSVRTAKSTTPIAEASRKAGKAVVAAPLVIAPAPVAVVTGEKIDLDKQSIKEAIAKGNVLIREGKTKADAATAIFEALKDEKKDVVIAAFVEGAALTDRSAVTYWYNCKRKTIKVISG